MKIKPSSEDNLLGEERPSQDYQLPDKTSVSLDVESDSRFTEWSYFWLKFSPGTVRPAWYRVFEKGKRPTKWQTLKPVKQVLENTGVDDNDAADDDPEETRRERDGKIGAAEKLPPGQYRLQVKIGRGDNAQELTGIEFKVKAAPPKPSRKPAEPQFSLTRPRCNATARASFIKLPKLAVGSLDLVARPIRFNAGPEFKPKDLYLEFLTGHGQHLAEYPWPAIMLVTLLPYLQEKHQIALMKSEHDKVTAKITDARKAPQYIFTHAHRQAFLKKLARKFSEPEMRNYFREYNGTDDPESGKRMLDGIRALRQSLSALDEDSVILFSVGFPPDHRAFLDAARTGDTKKVRELITQGVPVDVRDHFCIHYAQQEQTALMYAAGAGQLEVVRILLKAGASVTAVDEGSEQTPLHYAALQSNIAVVEELLTAGADPNALTAGDGKPGYTPLICALGAGQREVARLLIQRGTKLGLEIGGKRSYSPLCAVLEGLHGQVDTIRDLFLLLLEAGADPNGVGSSNRTALFSLLVKRPEEGTVLPESISDPLIRKLLAAGAKPDWLSDADITPLYTALFYQQVGGVKVLLKAGVDVNRLTREGTALDIVENKSVRIEKSLREMSGWPPVVDEETANRRKKHRGELEDKLRRCKKIRETLRRAGAKRKSHLR